MIGRDMYIYILYLHQIKWWMYEYMCINALAMTPHIRGLFSTFVRAYMRSCLVYSFCIRQKS